MDRPRVQRLSASVQITPLTACLLPLLPLQNVGGTCPKVLRQERSPESRGARRKRAPSNKSPAPPQARRPAARNVHTGAMRSVVTWTETPVSRGRRAEARCCSGRACAPAAPPLARAACFKPVPGCRGRAFQPLPPDPCPPPRQPEKDGVKNVCYDLCFKPGAAAAAGGRRQQRAAAAGIRSSACSSARATGCTQPPPPQRKHNRTRTLPPSQTAASWSRPSARACWCLTPPPASCCMRSRATRCAWGGGGAGRLLSGGGQ